MDFRSDKVLLPKMKPVNQPQGKVYHHKQNARVLKMMIDDDAYIYFGKITCFVKINSAMEWEKQLKLVIPLFFKKTG